MKKDIYAVIGDPVFHSVSPFIHNTLYNKYGINAIYLPIELNHGNYKKFILEYSKSLNLKGINVTMPLKDDIISILDETDEVSGFLSSVNTVDLKEMKGYTTDGKGFVQSLTVSAVDKKVVIIGAGGAARAIAYELKKIASNIVIINRTIQKAQEIANKLDVEFDSLDNIEENIIDCDILINTTSCGMAGKADFENLDFVDKLPSGAHVYDIIYNPIKTALLEKADRKGLTFQNGLGMLICQAFFAFEIFFGIMPSQKDKEFIERELAK